MRTDSIPEQASFLTVKDILQGSKVLEELRRHTPGFLLDNEQILNQGYTATRLSVIKRKMMKRFFELVMLHTFHTMAYLEYLPADVLFSYETMEKILREPSVLGLVENGKLSYKGLVSLAERGKL